jgi:hypothetical protein
MWEVSPHSQSYSLPRAMAQARPSFLWLGLLLSIVSVSALNEALVEKLAKAIEITTAKIQDIHKEWDISNYPNFLKTCSMHKTSLEIMKWKYMKKIVDAHTKGDKVKFVASFTGRYLF